MSEKCLFLPLKGSNLHLKFDFLTPGGSLYLPTKYQNFAQSPFKGLMDASTGRISHLHRQREVHQRRQIRTPFKQV